MQLQRLTGLERQKILDELAELLKVIERLRAILSSEELLMGVVLTELKANPRELRRRAAHGDHRGERRVPDRGPDCRRGHGDHGDQHRLHQADGDQHLPDAAARRKGRIGMRTREEDFVSHLFVASTHAYIMIFSDRAARTG